MNKTTRIIAATALAVPLVGGEAHATAVIAATEPTQIMNNIQLVAAQLTQIDQLAQQVQMVTNQINQYQTMLRNLASLPAVQWSHVTTLINDLRTLESTASGFAYAASNWDTLFNAQHPDFASYLASGSLSRTDFTAMYTKWNVQNAEAVKQAVSAAGLAGANFDTDANTIKTLERVSDSSDGQKQVLQAANKFSKMLNEQVLLLRKLMTSQAKMQATFMAQKNEQEAAQTAETLKATKSTRNFVTGREKYY